MRLGDRRFDIIEADALRPTSAYAGNLYSREYFELLRDHLRPGGLAVTWAPTPRVERTVAAVFTHTTIVSIGGLRIAIGSEQPIVWDPAVLIDRFQHARGYYELARSDIATYARLLQEARVEVVGPDVDRGSLDINTDLHPKDEYLVPDRPNAWQRAT
jgi:spermidine synthase